MIYRKLATQLIKYQFSLLRSKPNDVKGLDIVRGKKRVIGYLIEVEDGVNPKKISDFMGVSTARIANILNKLEEQELIVRTPDSVDKRQIVVNLTANGRTLGLEYQNEIISELSKMLEALGEDDAREYVRITKKIYEISKEKYNVIGKNNGQK